MALIGDGLVWDVDFWNLLLFFKVPYDQTTVGINWIAWGCANGLPRPTTRQRVLLGKVRKGDTGMAAYWEETRPPYQEPAWPDPPPEYDPEYDSLIPIPWRDEKEEALKAHFREWEEEDFVWREVQDELDAEKAELECCQAQCEAQCGGGEREELLRGREQGELDAVVAEFERQ